MKIIQTRLYAHFEIKGRKSIFRIFFNLILFMIFFVGAAVRRGPGIGFHVAIAEKAISLFFSGISRPQLHQLFVFPLDSVRYFEFDFFWRIISKYKSLGAYLDVSSPRLFSLRVLNERHVSKAVIANPDMADMRITKQLFAASGIIDLCKLETALIGDLKYPPKSFDTIICISVLEHIPFDDAPDALRTMWNLLKTGGRLLLSVPCAKDGFEEYLDFNEYGLLPPDTEGFVFGQRFYDQEMLTSQIFKIVGNPNEFAVFGEIVPGAFFDDREQKLRSHNYPYWREAYNMSTQWKYFSGIDSLPGLGVIALEFVKP